MADEKFRINGFDLTCHRVNTLVVGSGAASLNAALSLHRFGQKDIIIATENLRGGTSRNAGSDKQTYYKLSLSGDAEDSPLLMAEDLFNGHCMHGDIALCEALGSVGAFLNLANLGVPFPQNMYGAWVGYKTDHDPKARGTSAGPYTSKIMHTLLAEEAKRKKIKILDHVRIIYLLTSGDGNDKSVTGAIGINLRERDIKKAFLLFNCTNIILGTGGPAGIYRDSVFPELQSGSTGLAIGAGATAQNLTESQFGIASVKFRWNLSGSYQQVIPQYFSTDKFGREKKEFLNEFFPDIRRLTRAIFLKGYQWPFDPAKTSDYGSSVIDLLVYREKVIRGRKVFLDYSVNPSGPAGEKFSLTDLDGEVYDYLNKSGALKKTPFERLRALNSPAADLYLRHNIDLSKAPLEISVSVQHNNGGLKGNIWWESDLKHLFPVGEVNGSHGVYRPGGSALNSGQVGSSRAAFYISKRYFNAPHGNKDFAKTFELSLSEILSLATSWLENKSENHIKPAALVRIIRERMSEAGGIIREKNKVKEAAGEAWKLWHSVDGILSASSVRELADAFRAREHCLTHLVYLEALKKYIGDGGRSRGSYIVSEKKGSKPLKNLEDVFSFSLCRYDRKIENHILEIKMVNGNIIPELRRVRPIPRQELWFEKVWRQNLEDKIAGG
ncbi:MAG: FAD-binding protein [Bacteroidales bacterium]|nr:FAD-binding protein [Bacteroidales bacterium]